MSRRGRVNVNGKAARIVDMLRRGEAAATISAALGCTPAYVVSVAKRHGLPLIRRPEQIEKLAKQGLTAAQIGAKIGMEEHSVRIVAARERIQLPDRRPRGDGRGFAQIGWYPKDAPPDLYDPAKLKEEPVTGPVTIRTMGDAAEIERFMRERGVKKCPSAAVGPTQAQPNMELRIYERPRDPKMSAASKRGMRAMNRRHYQPRNDLD